MLLACLSCVIRFRTALWVGAENLTTVCQRATNSILGHAFGSFFCQRFVVIISCIHIDLALDDFHHVAATARYKVRILGHKLSLNNFLKLLVVLPHVFAELPVLDLFFAIPFWTHDSLAFFDLLHCSLC